MHTFIDFPNLGIHLENVGKTVTVFGFDIAYYGITIAVGMLAGILVATQVAKRTGQKQEDYIDLAIFGIIFGIIGARIYYVILPGICIKIIFWKFLIPGMGDLPSMEV